MLCAPIHRNERLISFIGTGYVARRQPFSCKQRRLIVGISHAVAVGVDNERLIRDLRAANRLKSDFELFALVPLLAEVETEVDALAKARGLHVAWRNALGPAVIPTDRVKLKTILKNLVGNAIEYTPQGSVTVAAHASADTLVLTVADTGIGIADTDLAAIFEMFRQVDGSTTSTAGGVGLGLYIVRQIVDRRHGSIAVDSTPGAGSTFTVRLPMQLDEASAAQTSTVFAGERARISDS